MKDIIAQVAKNYGVPREEVDIEIRKMIHSAMKSKEPEAQALWKELAPDGKEPSPEEFIAFIALKVRSTTPLC